MFRGRKGHGDQEVMATHGGAPDQAIYGGSAFGHSVSPTAHLLGRSQSNWQLRRAVDTLEAVLQCALERHDITQPFFAHCSRSSTDWALHVRSGQRCLSGECSAVAACGVASNAAPFVNAMSYQAPAAQSRLAQVVRARLAVS